MKITAKLGDCEITVDDGNSNEPASAKWIDQFQRIKEAVTLAADELMRMDKSRYGEERDNA